MQSPCGNSLLAIFMKEPGCRHSNLLAAAEIDNTSSEVKQAESNKFQNAFILCPKDLHTRQKMYQCIYLVCYSKDKSKLIP